MICFQVWNQSVNHSLFLNPNAWFSKDQKHGIAASIHFRWLSLVVWVGDIVRHILIQLSIRVEDEYSRSRMPNVKDDLESGASDNCSFLLILLSSNLHNNDKCIWKRLSSTAEKRTMPSMMACETRLVLCKTQQRHHYNNMQPIRQENVNSNFFPSPPPPIESLVRRHILRIQSWQKQLLALIT